MFLPIRDDISEALTEMEEFHKISDWRKSCFESFEYSLGLGVTKDKRKEIGVKMKGRANLFSERYQTSPPPVAKSTPDLHKRQREPTMSPQETAAKRSEEKPKTSMREEECLEIQVERKAPKPKLQPQTEVGKPHR